MNNPILHMKLESAVKGLQPYLLDHLKRLKPTENALAIANYLLVYDNERGLSHHHRTNITLLLKSLSQFNEGIPFNQMKSEHISAFLNSYKKTDEDDPLHAWIGTYNIYLTMLKRFFRWLYYPDIESLHRRKKTPPPVENIGYRQRKEKSIYTASDLWTEEDDKIFVKYALNTRDKCYHTMAKDTACRPHELLTLKLEDIDFPEGETYAQIHVNGKTGNRTLAIIDSIGYLKQWIQEHPTPTNPKAILFCGGGKSTNRRNHFKPMKTGSINLQYKRYKTQHLPLLLNNKDVPEDDKRKIQQLLKKPFNPYILRHSGLTEISKQVNENALRQQGGWSINSKNPQRYIHYFGNEAVIARLQAKGLTKQGKVQKDPNIRLCPNCEEINPKDGIFCLNQKCRMILSRGRYLETKHDQESLNERVNGLEKWIGSSMKLRKGLFDMMLEDLKDNRETIALLTEALAHIDPRFKTTIDESDKRIKTEFSEAWKDANKIINDFKPQKQVATDEKAT